MPHSALVPGYTYVEAFGPDDEYETNEEGDIEEEVTYVTLDLGSVEPTLVPSSSTYRLIGLDTPTPYLQLSGTVFQGKHQNLLGTELLFTEGKDAEDPSKKPIVHVANTEQRIRFKEVELKPAHARTPEPESHLPIQAKGKEKAGVASQPLDVMTGSAQAAAPDAPRRRGRKAKVPQVEQDSALAAVNAEIPAGDALPVMEATAAAGAAHAGPTSEPEPMDIS